MTSPPTEENRQEQFLRLFLASERELYRYVSVLVPSFADAAEIVQETALQLWKKFDEYDPSQPFTPWACRFGLNAARQWLARHERWAAVLKFETAERLLSRRAELLPEFEARFSRLESCLEKLPAEQRTLLEGYYGGRQAISELALQARQSVEAVYKSLQRIRHKLRACVGAALWKE
jgi:RNA polymerase sigma-70 factor, ECF subfamily